MSDALIESLNRLFAGIYDLDLKVRHDDRSGESVIPADIYDGINDLLKAWLVVARGLYLKADATCRDELLKNIQAAEWALTPDDEFFVSDEFVALRDKAYEEHRAGLTVPMCDRGDLADLMKGMREERDPEERARIKQLIKEILAQTPVDTGSMPMPLD